MNRKTRLTDSLFPAPQARTPRVLGPRHRSALPWRSGASSGGRSYVHFGEGRKVSLSSAVLRTVEEARQESRTLSTGGKPDKTTTPLFRDFAAGPWRDAWICRCKPSTVRWRDRNLNTACSRSLATCDLTGSPELALFPNYRIASDIDMS